MPRWTPVSVAFAPVVAGVLAACGGDAQPDANNPLAQLTAAAEQMQKAAESFTSNRKPVPPVAFRELIEFLPKNMAGMKRGGAERRDHLRQAIGSTHRRMWTSGARTASRAPTSASSTTPTSRSLYVPFNMFLNMKVANESTEGYERSTQDRRLSGVREVEQERQQRDRGAGGRAVHREGRHPRAGRGRGEADPGGHGPQRPGVEGEVAPVRPSRWSRRRDLLLELGAESGPTPLDRAAVGASPDASCGSARSPSTT